MSVSERDREGQITAQSATPLGSPDADGKNRRTGGKENMNWAYGGVWRPGVLEQVSHKHTHTHIYTHIYTVCHF